MSKDFTFRNRGMQQWLLAVIAASFIIALVFPPAFWLCIVGVVLLFTALLANSLRTGQWYSRQVERSLSGFEGWAGATGAVVMAVPLITILVRAWLAI
jgi:hypothetical protein